MVARFVRDEEAAGSNPARLTYLQIDIILYATKKGRSVFGSSTPQIPEEIQVDPLSGWKWARIKARTLDSEQRVLVQRVRAGQPRELPPRRIYLSGPVYDTEMKVEDEASCRGRFNTDAPHSIPELGCRCGFYALKIPTLVYSAEVLLQVELYGKVIQFERGYRAQYQRVLGGWIWSAPKCSCGHEPSRVGVDADGSLNSCCPDCVGVFKHQWSMSDMSAEVGIRLQFGWPEHSGVPSPVGAWKANYTGPVP